MFLNKGISNSFNLIILSILIITTRCGFNLSILSPDQINEVIFLENILDEHYNDLIYEEHLDCTNGGLELIEFEQLQGQQLIVFGYQGMDFTRKDIEISVKPNMSPKPYLKDLNRVYKKFTLNAGCEDVITRQNYFNKVVIKIRNVLKQKTPGSPQYFTFSFLLNCDYLDLHKNFEYGYLFIGLIGVFIVFFVSIHPRIFSLRIQNAPINIEIHWKFFLLIGFIVFACLGAMESQQVAPREFHRIFGKRSQFLSTLRFVHSFLKHLGLLVSFFAVFICMNQLIFEFPKLLRFISFQGILIRNVYITKRMIASLIIATIIYICGLWSQNLIFYNTLSCCICIAAIKMFRFRSLKNGVFSMIIVAFAVALTSIWSYYKLPRSYNDYASQLSSPLFIQVPDFVNNLYKKCSWISVLDLILPGAILAYLRNYDQNLHSQWRGVYTMTSIFSFILSNLSWMIIEALVSTNVPFCVITYPIFLSSICLMAHYRNEIDTIWDGNFQLPPDTTILQCIKSLGSGRSPQIPKQILDPLYEHSLPSESVPDSASLIKVKKQDNKIQQKQARQTVLKIRQSQSFRNDFDFNRQTKRNRQEDQADFDDSQQIQSQQKLDRSSPIKRGTTPKGQRTNSGSKRLSPQKRDTTPTFKTAKVEQFFKSANNKKKD